MLNSKIIISSYVVNFTNTYYHNNEVNMSR
jgi:hypothetical protein